MGKLEKKVNGIFNINPSKDKGGFYINYCNYWRHSGVLNENKAKKCINKQCKHYQRYEPK